MYFLISGRVNLLIGPHEMAFKSYLASTYFGEVDIFQQTLRKYTARCQVNCEFLTLDRDFFGELMDKFPSVESEMFTMAQKREAEIAAAAEKIKRIIGIAENDAFWKNKDILTYTEIIASQKMASLLQISNSIRRYSSSAIRNLTMTSIGQQTLNNQLMLVEEHPPKTQEGNISEDEETTPVQQRSTTILNDKQRR